VQSFADKLLAGAALADHQHRPVQRREPARLLQRAEPGRRFSDELFGSVDHFADLADLTG
jgi:hypothetical protein